VFTLAYELSLWGIDLRGLGKPLVYSEWSLGGSGRCGALRVWCGALAAECKPCVALSRVPCAVR
jgi:hypothetical protein